MKYYLAPMEGITGFVFRNAYHEYFEPMDKYFAPFISPNQNVCFTPREYRDICPENNQIAHVVPQILTNKAEDFIKTSQELARMGYEEVNLNLGCPSGTVTAKRKGAGFLMEPERLREFFDRIFESPCVRISVKTRLGMYLTDEFIQLLAIFNDYPLTELIIHPRVGKEFYDGVPHRDVYLGAVGKSKNLLCYNGDLYCEKDVRELLGECSRAECEAGLVEGSADGHVGDCGLAGCGLRIKTEDAAGGCTQECRAAEEQKMRIFPGGMTVALMFGRGILRDPWLVAKCRDMEKGLNFSSGIKQPPAKHRYLDAAHILEFSDRLFSDYAQYMGEHNAMFRMKELWLYLVESFAETDANRKKLKKAQNKAELDAVLGGLRTTLQPL